MFAIILHILNILLSFCYNSAFFIYDFVHIVLPLGLDIGFVGLSAFYLTRLRKPDPDCVLSIFGPDPTSKEAESSPNKVVKCIAHRGAGFDAPENTLEAFKYCFERSCTFVELDVRSLADGNLVLLHDAGLERLSGVAIPNVRAVNWERIRTVDISQMHPNNQIYKNVHLCLFEDAVDYLINNKIRMIIDVKGDDVDVIQGILKAFTDRPELYKYAAVTCFNPYILYQIRKKDPQIVGALSYRPYCFSAQDYDAENGPTNPRFSDSMMKQMLSKCLDLLHGLLWRTSARWCNVSAVLIHKDIVSPSEVSHWRNQGVRCIGWCVNRPVEKLYWRGVLRTPYLANTLVGEPTEIVATSKLDTSTSKETLEKTVT